MEVFSEPYTSHAVCVNDIVIQAGDSRQWKIQSHMQQGLSLPDAV